VPVATAISTTAGSRPQRIFSSSKRASVASIAASIYASALCRKPNVALTVGKHISTAELTTASTVERISNTDTSMPESAATATIISSPFT